MQDLFDGCEFSFELDGCTPPCSLSDMNKDFLYKLQIVYEKIPFHINSAYRSKEWEIAHKRSGSSSHVKGLAVDIHYRNSRELALLVSNFLAVGISRFGIAKTFLHVDADPDKVSPCIWLY